MALGLSPRCLGGDQQKVFFDDLSLPEFGVVEGEIATEYHFSPERNVSWTMSNEYLRRYLWMRGAYGVRVFYYEARLPDCPALREVNGGRSPCTNQARRRLVRPRHPRARGRASVTALE